MRIDIIGFLGQLGGGLGNAWHHALGSRPWTTVRRAANCQTKGAFLSAHHHASMDGSKNKKQEPRVQKRTYRLGLSELGRRAKDGRFLDWENLEISCRI
jgi:hypothetical protein